MDSSISDSKDHTSLVPTGSAEATPGRTSLVYSHLLPADADARTSAESVLSSALLADLVVEAIIERTKRSATPTRTSAVAVSILNTPGFKTIDGKLFFVTPTSWIEPDNPMSHIIALAAKVGARILKSETDIRPVSAVNLEAMMIALNQGISWQWSEKGSLPSRLPPTHTNIPSLFRNVIVHRRIQRFVVDHGLLGGASLIKNHLHYGNDPNSKERGKYKSIEDFLSSHFNQANCKTINSMISTLITLTQDTGTPIRELILKVVVSYNDLCGSYGRTKVDPTTRQGHPKHLVTKMPQKPGRSNLLLDCENTIWEKIVSAYWDHLMISNSAYVDRVASEGFVSVREQLSLIYRIRWDIVDAYRRQLNQRKTNLRTTLTRSGAQTLSETEIVSAYRSLGMASVITLVVESNKRLNRFGMDVFLPELIDTEDFISVISNDYEKLIKLDNRILREIVRLSSSTMKIIQSRSIIRDRCNNLEMRLLGLRVSLPRNKNVSLGGDSSRNSVYLRHTKVSEIITQLHGIIHEARELEAELVKDGPMASAELYPIFGGLPLKKVLTDFISGHGYLVSDMNFTVNGNEWKVVLAHSVETYHEVELHSASVGSIRLPTATS